MQAIAKWLIGILLGWLFEYFRELAEKYWERTQKEKERAEENVAAQEKLEEAKSEQEVVQAGSELLRR